MACDNNQTMVITMENATDITSPNFPNNYEINMACTWHIIATNDTRIELSVEGYEIER